MTVWHTGDDAADARHDDPAWAERFYPEHAAPPSPLPAYDRIPPRCPDTIPAWMLDQP